MTSEQDRTILGMSQFEIVAESSKEFDRYLQTTLGGTGADIAFADNSRYDKFTTSRAPNSQSSKPLPGSKLGGRHVTGHPDNDDSSDTDSGDDEEDESSADEMSRRKSRKSATKRERTQGQEGQKGDEGIQEYEQFQEFMRWKSMQS